MGIISTSIEDFESALYVLEYKYSFDALFEEIEKGDKDESLIDLVVCWEIGDRWKRRYAVTPLLHTKNLHHRQIHGVTHALCSSTTGEPVFWIIVLSELIDYLNDPDSIQAFEEEKYMND